MDPTRLAILYAILCVIEATSPSVSGQILDTTNLAGASGVAVDGNYAYVAAAGSHALTVVDVTNPALPTVSGQIIDYTNLNGASAVAVDGNYAYLAAQGADALTVVDVTNP